MKSSRLVGVLTWVLLSACGSATSKYPVQGTPKVAGADGEIKFKRMEGGNYMATIELKHLPPPERLGQGLDSYVVWFEHAGKPAERVSVLNYDVDDRTGVASATTIANNATVLITAEQGTKATTPSDVLVLKQHVQAVQ